MSTLVALAVLAAALAPLVAWIWRSRSRVAAIGLALSTLTGTLLLTALSRPQFVPESAVTNRPIEDPEPDDVGSQACRSCHPREYGTWDTSYHSSMTELPTPETVKATWNVKFTTAFTHMDGRTVNHTYSMLRRGDEFWVHSPDDPAFSRGSALPPELRKIVLVTGSHHQQFFWYETGEGRYVAEFPLAWSIRDSRWLPVSTMVMSPPAEPMALEGAWNLVCVRCHSTHGRPGAVKAEDAAGGTVATPRSFAEADTRATEFGIACESCHGGAREHSQRYHNPLVRYASHFFSKPDPTIVNPGKLDSRRATDVCGSCHSNHIFGSGTEADLAEFNRVGFTFRPGDDLSKSRIVMRYADRDQPVYAPFVKESSAFFETRFWPDGATSTAGREMNDMLETPCFQRGELSCLSCHQMHQAADDPRTPLEWADDQLDHRKLGNAACLDCHESFRERISEHTHHQAGSSGSLCTNCHMPNTTYGLRKQSRSHRIDSPDVRVALATGRPDACSLCHLDRPLVETARTLSEWYGIAAPEFGDPEHNFTGYGVMQALRGDAAIRSMFAWHMGWAPAIEASRGDWMVPVLARLLDDPYPAVRYVAGRSLLSHPGFEGFAYDYLSPPEQLRASARDALERWDRATPPERRRAGESVLIRSDGAPNQSRLERLHAQRDDRPVYRLE
jgi:hypothetical protein